MFSKVFPDMHPSQAIFSGEVPKKKASCPLSFWSLFLSAARTEHTLQYMPHGDRYSFFTTIFFRLLSSLILKNHNCILLQFAYTVCVEDLFLSYLFLLLTRAILSAN